MTVTNFTGGKRCRECDEQIDPRRVRAQPSASLCTDCQSDRDMAVRKAVNTLDSVSRGRITMKDRASITIKW